MPCVNHVNPETSVILSTFARLSINSAKNLLQAKHIDMRFFLERPCLKPELLRAARTL